MNADLMLIVMDYMTLAGFKSLFYLTSPGQTTHYQYCIPFSN